MALALYSSPDSSSILSSDKPFTLTFDGRIGGAQDRCVYIRNDDYFRWYTDISISVIGSVYQWKLMTKDTVPSHEEWRDVSTGTLVLDTGIGSSSTVDIVTFLPVWVHVEVPRDQLIQTITSINLRIAATEHKL